MIGRAARLHTLFAGLFAVALAAPAAAAERIAHPSGVFAFMAESGWAKDEESDEALSIKCGPEVCAEEDGWCEAKVSRVLDGSTRGDFLGMSPKDFDLAFRSSAGDEGAFEPTVAYERRKVGANDGFYGEYDLSYKAVEGRLSVVRFQSFNKGRIVDLSCMALPERLPTIRKIVETFELPS